MLASEAAELMASFLPSDGETVVISRIVGGNPPTIQQTPAVPAFVRQYRPIELGNGIEQGDSQVTLLGDALAMLTQSGLDPLIPRLGDKILIRGRQRNIQAAAPIAIGSQIVRLDLQVRG